MQQLFIVGASTAYGVGGANGGWADMLKLSIHQMMFKDNGLGEKIEVYNLSVPGATITHQIEKIEKTLPGFRKANSDIVIILQPGFNDAKAVNAAENFISNIEMYAEQVSELLKSARMVTQKVACFGMQPVDETKTTPKTSANGKSFFWNNRNLEFETALGRVCDQHKVSFAPFIQSGMEAGWLDKVYIDGLHPNKKGHEWFYQQIKPKTMELLTS